MSNTSEIPPYEMNGEEIAEVFFKILIYMIGVIGNLLVIFVIIFLEEYKKITHWYVLQMALADILFLQNLPFKVTEDINGRWIHSAGLCSSQNSVLYLTYYASILFLTIMAIDRYLAVCHSMSNTVQRIRTSRYAYVVALVTWIISLCMSVPAMLYSDISGNHPYCKCLLEFPKDQESPRDWCVRQGLDKPSVLGGGLEECITDIYPTVHTTESCIVPDIEDGSGVSFGDIGETSGNTETDEGTIQPGCLSDKERPGWQIFTIFNFVAMFVVPLLIILTCYSLIVRRLLKSTVSNDSSTGKLDKDKRRVTILCALLALLFTIFWLPFHSVHLARLVGIVTNDSSFCGRLSAATIILAYMSSATNPYLYNFLGSFKNRMKQIKESKRMQSLLVGTGLTGETRTRASAAASSSDGPKAGTSVSPSVEEITLHPIGVKE